MRQASAALAAVWAFTACTGSAPEAPIAALPEDRASLLAADSAWMQASISRDADRMIAFYAPNAVADFGPSEVMRGAGEIHQMWTAAFADSTFRLDWVNQGGDVIGGTTSGYTIGRWRQRTATTDSTGPYVAVWQKQADGKWLVLLDTAR